MYAAGSLIGRDGITFLKLSIPELAENYGHWQLRDVSQQANYYVKDILARQSYKMS